MRSMIWKKTGWAAAIAAWTLMGSARPAEELTIEKVGALGRIPIAVEGYSGEAAQVLRFDLEIAGFRYVDRSQAQYLLAGKSVNRVEGALTDLVSGARLFSKAYTGATLRVQAHALADDVVQAVTGRPGIARTRIAFRVTRNGVSEIYVADYDGHNPIQITRDGTVTAAPCWAPGQNKLLYVTYRFGNADILLHDLNTGRRAFVARYSGSNISPAASPDGRRVAMILSKSGSPDLYVANLDGSGLRQLTQTPGVEACPTWSPDGRWIAYSTRLGGRRVLAKVPVSGGVPKRIPTSGVLNPTEADWSPDGRWIAFTSQMGGFEICVVPAGGGEARILVSGEDPVWAPNSRTLIYVRRAGGRRQLSLLDVFTKERKDVARSLGDCSQPTWAR